MRLRRNLNVELKIDYSVYGQNILVQSSIDRKWKIKNEFNLTSVENGKSKQ